MKRQARLQRTSFLERVATNAYNGEIPGQTWRVKRGDTLRSRVINNMTLPVSAEQAANQLSRGLQAVPSAPESPPPHPLSPA